jgi:Cd(II)/Pb(II)-responsive transcriptional regulator
VETVRFYEREGLLPPPRRTPGNYRLYDDAHIERLTFIRRCRSLDMTLDEVRTLLNVRDAPSANCAEVNVLIDAHIGEVAERIAQLKGLETQLKALRRLCSAGGEVGNCGILKSLSRTPTPVDETLAETALFKANRNAVHTSSNAPRRR